MKHTQIKADGTVYWYDTSTTWGEYLTTNSRRFPFVRLDDKRYSEWGRRLEPAYRENPKGKYIRVDPVGDDGKPKGKPGFILPAYVRDTYTAVKEHHDRIRAARDKANLEHREQSAAARQRLQELRSRVAALGLEKVIHVHVVDHRYDTAPRVQVEFAPNSEAALRTLLDKLEAATDNAVFQRGFEAGQAVNDAQRDQALSYELRPEQRQALERYDPDFADRLAGGAYDRQ